MRVTTALLSRHPSFLIPAEVGAVRFGFECRLLPLLHVILPSWKNQTPHVTCAHVTHTFVDTLTHLLALITKVKINMKAFLSESL